MAKIKRPDLTNYPNLAAVLQGCVSGTLGEWPGVRAELSLLLESFGVPDSKPYKWRSFDEYRDSNQEFEGSWARAAFNAARERKEG